MVYMGSKAKYAKFIIPIIQEYIDRYKITTYIEPFVGGANVIDKIQCENKYGYDKSHTLISLHQQGQKDSSIIPAHGSPEWWYEAKELYRNYKGDERMDKTMEPYLVGAIQFFGSFSNGGFSRGYAKNSATRDYYNEAYRNFIEQVQQPLYKDIKFDCKDYRDIKTSNALIYCDPPYEGTKPYGYAFETKFDHKEYWNWVRAMSKENIIICSEQNLPSDFTNLWEQEVKRTNSTSNNFRATEKLGIWEECWIWKKTNQSLII